MVEKTGTQPGNGNGKVEPSENVKALSEASNKRQDDLRMATDALFDAKLHGVKDLMLARYRCAEALAKAEARRIDEQVTLRASYNERLEIAESKRIDAIRAVDVNAVGVASQRAADQAQVLATQLVSSADQLRSQVATTAETLRALVATNATALAQQQQQFSQQTGERLTKLEQAQYEGKGRAQYTDPQTTELLSKVNVLSELSKTAAGAQSGSASSWTTFVAIIGMIGVAASIGLTMLLSGRSTPSAPATPQVIYLPAPAGAVVPAAPAPAPPSAPAAHP